MELPKFGEYRAIGQMLTKIESGELKFDHSIEKGFSSEVGNKIVVGVTGSSGVGKSTFINSLICVALANNRKIAVLAIDPMSEKDKGTFLGDRLRFDHSYPDEGVYIRSISSSGAAHDVPETVEPILTFLGIIGYDFLIVESIGIGQSDAMIKMKTDKLIYIPSLDLEDWVQALKNEALINANIIFVNNRDGKDQHKLTSTISQILEMRNDKQAKTMLTSGNAKDGIGVKEVYNFLIESESRQ